LIIGYILELVANSLLPNYLLTHGASIKSGKSGQYIQIGDGGSVKSLYGNGKPKPQDSSQEVDCNAVPMAHLAFLWTNPFVNSTLPDKPKCSIILSSFPWQEIDKTE
jgi:hypothetical protein